MVFTAKLVKKYKTAHQNIHLLALKFEISSKIRNFVPQNALPPVLYYPKGGRRRTFIKILNHVKKLLTAFVLSACGLTVCADLMEEARLLVNEGDFWQARKLLDKAASDNQKLPQSAQYNYLLGACEFGEGNYEEARKLLEAAKAKGNGASNLYLGRLAFLDYDFEKASDFYAEFKRHREKNGLVAGETVEELEAQLASAENAMERVEKIEVIDSISVPIDGFFKEYKLPRSAGRLLLPSEMPLEDHRAGAVVAFMNEGGDFMMWGEPDSVGNVRLVESERLTDGTWLEPTPTPDILNKDGYADYPFMMPDGVTLYYASDGNDSMGGYDIFVATRDATTGEYLQPQNIGMPFNSPHDDFMLAIDEENGVGWWATDRNLLGDKVTIYVYVVNDLRRNYDADDEDLLAKARLSDYRSTQNPDVSSRYDRLLATIAAIDPEADSREPDFMFPVGSGNYYTSYSDFKSAKARELMNDYLLTSGRLGEEKEKLGKLRERYRVNHADNVKEEILKMEASTEKLRTNITKLRSEIYRYEKGTK